MVSRRVIAALLGGLWLASGLTGVATAADTDLSKTAGGVTVYLGIVPAEIVKGLRSGSATERPMHGRIPRGPMNITSLPPSLMPPAVRACPMQS